MGELNPHGFPRQILSLVRLPISPHPLKGCKSKAFEQNRKQICLRKFVSDLWKQP